MAGKLPAVAGYWLKAIGHARGPLAEDWIEARAALLRSTGFPRRPRIEPGDRLVLYASVWRRVFALAQVVGEPQERDHPRWPWTVEIETLLLVPGARRRAAGGGDRRRRALDEPAVAHPHHRGPLPARARGDRVRSLRAMIDLRSDTVTLPTDAMRAAMAAAPLGDDQFGEDPSVNLLQERVAELLGKEAGLFVPTGTMANQLPLKLYCQPGDDVVVGEESHAVWHETGAAAANAGVQFTTAGSGGLYTADELRAVLKPRGHLLFPPTTLVEVEDTQNRMGGLVWDRAELEAVCAVAREHGAASYLDGARLLNAAAARGDHPADARRAVRPRLDRALQGPRLSGRVGARRHARGHRGPDPLPPDARRRDAPGGRARRGGPARARSPRRAPPPGPRQRAQDRREAVLGRPACSSTSSGWRRTSSSSGSARARRTPRPSSRARRSAACS